MSMFSSPDIPAPPPMPVDPDPEPEAAEAQSAAKARARRRRGRQSTILTSPLGATGYGMAGGGRAGLG